MPPLIIEKRSKPITIRRARVDEIIPLRHRILRAGLPKEEAHFTGDNLPETQHVAAFDADDAICCATFVLNA